MIRERWGWPAFLVVVALAGLSLVLVIDGSAGYAHKSGASRYKQVFLKVQYSRAKVRPSKVLPPLINPPFGKGLRHNWKHWGSKRTSARGLMYYDTCRPDCAAGYHTDSGSVLLNDVRRCHGQRRYRKIHMFFDHHRAYNARFRVDCKGRVTHYASG